MTANKYVRVVQTILNKAEREWSWGNRAATKWNAALALQRAELAAGKAVETDAANRATVRAEVAENTISAQPTGRKRHRPWATA